MTTPDYRYYKAVFEGQTMPFAFVDLDILNRNAEEVIRRAAGKNIRIATKSIRCRYLLAHLLKSSNQFQGLMCFSVREALWLSDQGFDDLLMGYPAWNTGQLSKVAKKIMEGKKITLMADLPEHLDHLNNIGKKEGVILPVCLDLDMSTRFPGIWFGVQRSSVRNIGDVRLFIQKVRACPNIRLSGLMGYEAQIAGIEDSKPGQWLMNKVLQTLKQKSVKTIAEKRQQAAELINSEGIDLEFINGGGTGSLESTVLEGWVTEVTVGSAFYASHLFDHYRNFKHSPASVYAIEIIRKPEKNIFTCLGGGYVASGAAGVGKAPEPYLPEGAKFLKHELAGEVQTPVEYNGKINLNLGDPVFLRHSKAGELFEHFNHIHLVSQGDIVKTTATYRGEGYTF